VSCSTWCAEEVGNGEAAECGGPAPSPPRQRAGQSALVDHRGRAREGDRVCRGGVSCRLFSTARKPPTRPAVPPFPQRRSLSDAAKTLSDGRDTLSDEKMPLLGGFAGLSETTHRLIGRRRGHGGQEDGVVTHGWRLAGRSDKVSPCSDKPLPSSDKPSPCSDKPSPSFDKPLPSFDKPSPSFDKPSPHSDKLAGSRGKCSASASLDKSTGCGASIPPSNPPSALREGGFPAPGAEGGVGKSPAYRARGGGPPSRRPACADEEEALKARLQQGALDES
jgi:hypothetical protein